MLAILFLYLLLLLFKSSLTWNKKKIARTKINYLEIIAGIYLHTQTFWALQYPPRLPCPIQWRAHKRFPSEPPITSHVIPEKKIHSSGLHSNYPNSCGSDLTFAWILRIFSSFVRACWCTYNCQNDKETN